MACKKTKYIFLKMYNTAGGELRFSCLILKQVRMSTPRKLRQYYKKKKNAKTYRIANEYTANVIKIFLTEKIWTILFV